MWHDIVSFVESLVQHLMIGFFAMGSQHPVTAVGILLLFVLLGALLCAEVVESRTS